MKKKLLVVGMFLLGIIVFMSCEKETEVISPENPVNSTDFSKYVDFSWYNTEDLKTDVGGGGCGLYTLPYYFVWQQETTLQLEDVCACLPTICGDCFPEVTIRTKSNEINSESYEIFKRYNGDAVSYLINENWGALLPMLKQKTVDLIISGELELLHEYSNENKIAYFCVVNPEENMENIFTIQLKMEE